MTTAQDHATEIADPAPVEPAVLIEEARQRQHERRRRIGVALAFGTVVLALVGYLLAGGSFDGTTATAGNGVGGPRQGAVVTPTSAQAIAISPSGTLYVAAGRQTQLVRRLQDGQFAEVASAADHNTLSTEGRQARHARNEWPVTSVAVAPNGIVYFSDSFYTHVLAVQPHGKVAAVPGTATLGGIQGMSVGPTGVLYILTSSHGIYALAPGSSPHAITRRSARPVGASERAEQAAYDQQTYNGIAVNRAGDIFYGSYQKLYERTPNGRFRFLGGHRIGMNAPGLLAAGADGQVYDVSADHIFRVTANGQTPVGLSERQIASKLRWPGSTISFGGLVPSGIGALAIALDGTVYVVPSGLYTDDFEQIGEEQPSGITRVLWAGSSRNTGDKLVSEASRPR